MKFIHCADIHIGGSKFIPDSISRSTRALHDIFAVAKSRNISTVVIAGDIFDEGITTSTQRDLVEEILLGYDAAGFNILVIPGNHDVVNRGGETSLRYLSIMYDMGRFKNSTIVEATTYRQIDDTIFILLVHRDHKFSEDLKIAIDNLKNSSVQLTYKHVVVVAHELIQGSVLDNNFVAPKGENLISDPYITYVALGDIHKAQRVGPNAYYSGAPYQIKFGDDAKKGFLIVDTDNPDNPEFVQLESKQLIIATCKEEIKDDCYVKLVSDKLDTEGQSLPENVIKTSFTKSNIELTVKIDEEGNVKDNVLKTTLEQLQAQNMSDLVELAAQEISEIFA